MKSQKTFAPKAPDLHKMNREKAWKLIDAKGIPAGRLASQAARLLQGKHKPEFTPYLDNGDFVVVINSDQMVLTGKKWTNKKYYRHSRFPGSLKEWTPKDMKTDEILKRAVQGMLPKNKLRKKRMRKLKIYRKSEHKHKTQKVEAYTF